MPSNMSMDHWQFGKTTDYEEVRFFFDDEDIKHHKEIDRLLDKEDIAAGREPRSKKRWRHVAKDPSNWEWFDCGRNFPCKIPRV